MKKLFLSISILSLLFTACESDDTADIVINNNGGTDNNNPSTDVIYLSGTQTADLTLKADKNYVLNGPLVMPAGTKLTIEPGTTVKALAEGTQVYIAILQGAQIIANGTASKPITFTSNAATPKAGDWGGILIMGKAPINRGATATSEVGNFTYGGADAADNSGVLNYVIAKYTGAKINADAEFNGFSLYGVGSGTTINNVEAYEGADDGLEFFGGTVSATNVVVINAEDDSVDWTDGWVGTLTNTYIKQKAEHDKIIEADNLDTNNTAAPYSNPTIKNMTVYGDITKYTDRGAFHLRRGTKAKFSDVYIKNAPYAFLIDNTTTIDNVISKELQATGVKLVDITTNLTVKGTSTSGKTITEADLYTTKEVSPIDLTSWTWVSL